jgi:hypothetical protein
MNWAAYLDRRTKEVVKYPTIYVLMPIVFGLISGSHVVRRSWWDLSTALVALAGAVVYSLLVARAIRKFASC